VVGERVGALSKRDPDKIVALFSGCHDFHVVVWGGYRSGFGARKRESLVVTVAWSYRFFLACSLLIPVPGDVWEPGGTPPGSFTARNARQSPGVFVFAPYNPWCLVDSCEHNGPMEPG